MGTHCLTEVTSKNIMKFLALAIIFLSCLCAVLAMPYPMPYPYPYAMPDEPGYAAPAYGGAIGRVKIQAYRGPSKPGNGVYDTFAPWGFYVSQPKDNFGATYHHRSDLSHARVARSAFPQNDQPAFAWLDGIRLDGIKSAEEQIAAGSGHAGGDAVDYGAYTGGYGAFGWYSDHPNHEGVGHRRRRRSPQDMIGAPLRYAPAPLAPSYDQYEADLASAGSNAYAKGPKGRVGPVYTFVKTDPKANFKWGVRHVAGVQYGK